ncbi:ACP phosphodiesterase [Alteromonas sp. H39]|uniref:acyl carrier protein phosphodiesterase n=1 Tax=Alteromonas sp. H39 TaxID=3389876 RepID=UPI0039DF53B5
MNYFAHLYLAQPTNDSFMGNLLGDFRKGEDTNLYSPAVQAGVQNHLLVDRLTDNHPAVRSGRALFSRDTRRFSGVALDVLFDHYLISEWQHYHTEDFDSFKAQCYRRLSLRLQAMPPSMQPVMTSVIERDWFGHYATYDGTLQAIENLARRVRFPNQFARITQEIAHHDKELREGFRVFFPQLVEEVKRRNIENG